MSTRLLILLLLLLGCLPVAYAYEPDIHDYDLNGDGHVTFEELMNSAGKGSGKMLQKLEPLVRKAFNAVDRNKDGVLSAEDFDNFRKGMQRLQRWLNRLRDALRKHEEPPAVEGMQQT